MKYSKYNNLIKVEDKFYLFNSFRNSIIQLDDCQKGESVLSEVNNISEKEFEFLKKSGVIIDDYLDETIILEHNFQQKKYLDSEILHLNLYPSYDCNLNCNYCFVKSKLKYDTKVYYSDVSKFIESNKKYSKFKISILGGEPLLHFEDLIEFLEWGDKKSIDFSIVTNGSINMTESQMTKLVKIKNLKTMQFTFDGDEIQHDSIKQVGAFSNSINLINDLSSIFEGYFIIRLNIQKKTKIDDMITRLSSEILFPEKCYFSPSVITKTNSQCEKETILTPDEKYNLLDKAYSLLKQNNMYCDNYLTPSFSNCTFFIENGYIISPDLKLYKCDDLQNNVDFSIGRINDSEIQLKSLDSYSYSVYLKKRTQTIFNSYCESCNWLPLCKMGCPISKSSYPQCKIFVENSVKIHIKYFSNDSK